MIRVRLLLALAALVAAMPAAARDLAVVGARLYAAPDAAAIDDSIVLIHDGRIAAVGRHGGVAVPDDEDRIDARGKVLTAGFWNSHVHLTTDLLIAPVRASDAALGDALAAMFTRWGFTTIFDLASTMAGANEIRSRIADGRVAGPQILTAGEPSTRRAGRRSTRGRSMPSIVFPRPKSVRRTRRSLASTGRWAKGPTGSSCSPARSSAARQGCW